jgi:hypothetical protein
VREKAGVSRCILFRVLQAKPSDRNERKPRISCSVPFQSAFSTFKETRKGEEAMGLERDEGAQPTRVQSRLFYHLFSRLFLRQETRST